MAFKQVTASLFKTILYIALITFGCSIAEGYLFAYLNGALNQLSCNCLKCSPFIDLFILNFPLLGIATFIQFVALKLKMPTWIGPLLSALVCIWYWRAQINRYMFMDRVACWTTYLDIEVDALMLAWSNILVAGGFALLYFTATFLLSKSYYQKTLA